MTSARELIAELEGMGFRCNGGQLANDIRWQRLRAHLGVSDPGQIELDPCVYCGSLNVSIVVQLDKPENRPFWVGKCEACHGRGPRADSLHEAQMAWNERWGCSMLSPAETAVLDLLAEAYTLFTQLPVLHPTHQQEFMFAIHAAQRLVMARPSSIAQAREIEVMGYRVWVHPDEDGYFVAQCLELPDCISQGKTIAAAVTNIAEAIEGYVEEMP